MTWSLRESPGAVAVAADRVEAATGIPMAHIEKDFWVTEVLRGVTLCSAELGVTAVFKGGTSLSKAFGLIRRFSEDVDIIVVTTGLSTGAAGRCLKSFVAAAEDTTGLDANIDGELRRRASSAQRYLPTRLTNNRKRFGPACCSNSEHAAARCRR